MIVLAEQETDNCIEYPVLSVLMLHVWGAGDSHWDRGGEKFLWAVISVSSHSQPRCRCSVSCNIHFSRGKWGLHSLLPRGHKKSKDMGWIYRAGLNGQGFYLCMRAGVQRNNNAEEIQLPCVWSGLVVNQAAADIMWTDRAQTAVRRRLRGSEQTGTELRHSTVVVRSGAGRWMDSHTSQRNTLNTLVRIKSLTFALLVLFVSSGKDQCLWFEKQVWVVLSELVISLLII